MNNTTALAIIQPDELDTIQRTAKLLAASGYFGTSDGITGIAQIAAKILAGRELGFGPFAAVNGIHLIQGKPTVGANLMAAAVRSHPRYDYRVKELTDTVCELEFFDNGKLAGNSRFTSEEALKAELSNGKNSATWKKYPRNMLFARAMSNGVRWFAPDIFSGNATYTPEELGADVDDEGNVIEVSGRRVDQVTGEILESGKDVDFGMGKPVNGNGKHAENPFDADQTTDQGPEKPVASKSQLNKMHALGMEFHGSKDEWNAARPVWVKKASHGDVTSSKELSPKQADWIIASLEKRIAQTKAESETQAELEPEVAF